MEIRAQHVISKFLLSAGQGTPIGAPQRTLGRSRKVSQGIGLKIYRGALKDSLHISRGRASQPKTRLHLPAK